MRKGAWSVVAAMMLGCMLAGCAAAAKSRLRAALKLDEPPDDFALAVTVRAPPPARPTSPGTGATPTAPPARRVGPARFVMETDWILRASVVPGVSEDTFPGQTRQLTHDQVQRLWWELRDSGLLAPGAPPAAGRPASGSAVISYSVAGVRRTLAPTPADRPPGSRIVDRLAELAWLRQ